MNVVMEPVILAAVNAMDPEWNRELYEIVVVYRDRTHKKEKKKC